MPWFAYAVLVTFEMFLLLLAVGLLVELRTQATGRRTTTYEELIDSPAPEFSVAELHSRTEFDVEAIGRGRVTLVFVSTSCGVCKALVADLKAIDVGRLLIACKDTRRRCEAFAETLEIAATVLVDPVSTVASRYAATRSPTVICIVDGVVRGHGHPGSAKAVQKLWAAAVRRAG